MRERNISEGIISVEFQVSISFLASTYFVTYKIVKRNHRAYSNVIMYFIWQNF